MVLEDIIAITVLLCCCITYTVILFHSPALLSFIGLEFASERSAMLAAAKFVHIVGENSTVHDNLPRPRVGHAKPYAILLENSADFAALLEEYRENNKLWKQRYSDYRKDQSRKGDDFFLTEKLSESYGTNGEGDDEVEPELKLGDPLCKAVDAAAANGVTSFADSSLFSFMSFKSSLNFQYAWMREKDNSWMSATAKSATAIHRRTFQVNDFNFSLYRVL